MNGPRDRCNRQDRRTRSRPGRSPGPTAGRRNGRRRWPPPRTKVVLSVPLTVNSPSARSRSSGAHSIMCAASRLALATHAIGGGVDRHAGGRQRARAPGADAHGHPVGIALDHVDVVDVAAEAISRDLAPSGLVALPVAVAAGEDGDTPVRMDAHAGDVVAADLGAEVVHHLDWAGARHVEEGRDADAHPLALRPERRLLGAERIVIAERLGLRHERGAGRRNRR